MKPKDTYKCIYTIKTIWRKKKVKCHFIIVLESCVKTFSHIGLLMI